MMDVRIIPPQDCRDKGFAGFDFILVILPLNDWGNAKDTQQKNLDDVVYP